MGQLDLACILVQYKGKWLSAIELKKISKISDASLYNNLKSLRKSPWVDKRKIVRKLKNGVRRAVWHYRAK